MVLSSFLEVTSQRHTTPVPRNPPPPEPGATTTLPLRANPAAVNSPPSLDTRLPPGLPLAMSQRVREPSPADERRVLPSREKRSDDTPARGAGVRRVRSRVSCS